jgi:hypothetical protein
MVLHCAALGGRAVTIALRLDLVHF